MKQTTNTIHDAFISHMKNKTIIWLNLAIMVLLFIDTIITFTDNQHNTSISLYVFFVLKICMIVIISTDFLLEVGELLRYVVPSNVQHIFAIISSSLILLITIFYCFNFLYSGSFLKVVLAVILIETIIISSLDRIFFRSILCFNKGRSFLLKSSLVT